MERSFIKTSFINNVIDSYLTPTDNNLHKIFMPISQYPEVYGLCIKDFYRELTSGSAIACHTEFSVENIRDFDVTLSIGSIALRLRINETDRRSQLFYQNQQIASLPPQKHYSFNLRIYDEKLYLAVNERRLICIEENIASFNLEMLEIQVSSGYIHLINFQYYDVDWKLTVKEYGYFNDEVSKKITNTSPKYVLLWEHRAKELYQALLLAFEALNEGGVVSTEFETKIKDFSTLIIRILEAWPKWRPSSNSELGNCIWETNNWCNGYLPSAYALASKIINQRATEVFINRGLDWLVDKRYVQNIRMVDKFPSVTHWLNRSTNHGIVILSTLLVGACILNLYADKRVQVLYEDLKLIIKNSLKDGSYLESVSYFQFIILELIPLFHYLSKVKGLTPAELASNDFKELSRSINYVNAVTNHDTKRYFAKYGDCEPAGRWFSSVLVFLSAINDSSNNLSFTHDLINKENELYYFFIGSYEHKLKVYDCLGQFNDVNEYNIGYHLFSENQFAQIKYSNQMQSYYLWINGSKLHKTHNKDNDLGSFYLADSLGEIFVKDNGVDIRHHNVVTVKELLHEGISTPVTKLEIDEYKLPRGINGSIEFIFDNYEAYIFKHTANSYLKSANENLIKSHTRFFVILKEKTFNLVIVDMIASSVKLKCESRFHIHPNIKLDWNSSSHKLECDRLKVSSLGGYLETSENLVLNVSDGHAKVNRLVTIVRGKGSNVQDSYFENLLSKLKI